MTRHVIEMWGCSLCGHEEQHAGPTSEAAYKAVCMAGWYADKGKEICPGCAKLQREQRRDKSRIPRES